MSTTPSDDGRNLRLPAGGIGAGCAAGSPVKPCSLAWLVFAACFLFSAPAHSQKPNAQRTYFNFSGTLDAAQYSALTQINRSNVGRLKIAWKYPTGDGNKYLFNPIVIDGVMYVLAKQNS